MTGGPDRLAVSDVLPGFARSVDDFFAPLSTVWQMLDGRPVKPGSAA